MLAQCVQVKLEDSLQKGKKLRSWILRKDKKGGFSGAETRQTSFLAVAFQVTLGWSNPKNGFSKISLDPSLWFRFSGQTSEQLSLASAQTSVVHKHFIALYLQMSIVQTRSTELAGQVSKVGDIFKLY